MNDVHAAMAAHRSVRSYTDDPVPDETIRAAVEAARCASTSSWIHAYHLLQVTDPEVRGRLVELTGAQPQVARAGAFFVVCGDTRRHRLIAAREGAPYENSLELFLLAVIDASLFAQNLALALESEGLGICFVGGLRNDLDAVDALLGFPAGVWPLYGMCAGTPADRGATRPRLPAEAVWSKDRYPSDEEVLAATDAFDGVAAEHYAARGLAGRNWSGGVWRKFRRPLRTALAAFYRSKGASFE